MNLANSVTRILGTLTSGILLLHVAPAWAQTKPGTTQAPARWVELTKPASDTELPGSVFAVVTSKGGLASGLAHNHFVRASDYQLTVTPGNSPLTPGEVRMRFASSALVVDDPAVIAAAGARLKKLGLAHAEFTKLGDSDRESIRKNMLAEDQLAGDKFPTIEVVATQFRQQAGKMGNEQSNYVADFVFTVRGKTVKKTIPLSISQTGAQSTAQSSPGAATGASPEIVIEGLASARFEEFGFKAYSGLLGAVRNQDEFHFYFRSQGQWNP
jgi:hypothetical protein